MINSKPKRDPERIEQKILQEFLAQPIERVLDIGCGDGRLTWLFRGSAGEVIGLDIKMEELQRAHLSLSNTESTKVNFTAGRGEALPFTSETFDLAVFGWSL
jgi:ubiquinone/menaquinone biosynthesis C-methylase UbiE